MSLMVAADKELMVESKEDMAAENKATMTRPMIPCGSDSVTKVGTARL